MNIVNEKVEHIMFGVGVITEAKEDKIWVQFQEAIGIKAFLYPEAFEKFLKAVNPELRNSIFEESRKKQELIEVEQERKEKEREDEKEAAELEAKKEKLEILKKSVALRSRKKKVMN